jgi:branched-chain amino acid transport system substrate-binding protein
VGAVMQPAGAERAVGIVSSSFFKDPTDSAWDKDPGMEEWRAFMKKYYSEGDLQDSNNVWGYSLAHSIVHVLSACGNDLSRENIMKQITTLNKLENPVLLPGITLSTSPTNYRPITQLQMIKWNGKSWDRFGEVIQSQ